MKNLVVFLSVLFIFISSLTPVAFSQINIKGILGEDVINVYIGITTEGFFSVGWNQKTAEKITASHIVCSKLFFHSELESLERPQDYVQVLCAYGDEGKEVWRGGFFPKEISGGINFPAGKLIVVSDSGYNYLDFKLYPNGCEKNYHFRFSQLWTGNIVEIVGKRIEVRRDLDQKEAFYITEAEGEIEVSFADEARYVLKYAGPDFSLQETGVEKTEMRATRFCLLDEEVVFWKNTWNGQEDIREEPLRKEGFVSAQGSIFLKQSDGMVYELTVSKDKEIVLFLVQGGDRVPIQIGNQLHCSWIVKGSTGWNRDGSENPIRFICLENVKGASLSLSLK